MRVRAHQRHAGVRLADNWLGPALLVAAGIAAYAFVPWDGIAQWAALQQRGFQNAMARSLRAIQSGEPAAILSLCLATGAYGFVHALGPGHGKILLGGAAVASGATLRRMAWLTLAASLAQSGTAILLVLVLLQAFRLASADAVALTETWLAPLSYAAVAAVGAALVWRGILASRRSAASAATQPCACGHAHGPSLTAVRSLHSGRDVAALIGSIAIRPCTGALFLLVIAARFEVFAAGILAVLAMGLGTASLNVLVAGSGVAAHRLAFLGEMPTPDRARQLSAGLHIAGGVLILGFSLILLKPYLG